MKMVSKQKKYFGKNNLIAMVGTLISFILCIGVLNYLNLWNPASDVVGGSAIFRTNTLLYTTLAVLVFLCGPIYALIGYLLPNEMKNHKSHPHAKPTKRNLTKFAKEQVLLTLASTLLLFKILSFILFVGISPIANTPERALELISNPKFLFLLFLTTVLGFQVYRNRINGAEYVLSHVLLGALIFFVPVVLMYNMFQDQQTTPVKFIQLFAVFQILTLVSARSQKLRIKCNYAAAIVIFYLISFNVPGSVQSLNYFEDYPYLNVHAYRSWDYLPWKDLQLNHGLYSDFLRQLFGSVFINDTAWGIKAGIDTFLFPIEIVAAVLLLGMIFSNIYKVSLISIVGFAFLKYTPTDSQNSWFLISSLPRVLPLLLSTLILKKYFFEAKLKYRLYLILCGTFAILWSSEGISNIAGISIALLVNLLTNRRSLKLKKIVDFFIITILPFLLAFIILEPFGLAKAFIADFQGMTANILQGNLPFNFRTGLLYSILVFLIPIVISYSGYIYAKSIMEFRKNPYLYLIPSLITGAYFYIKFLAWPDLHIQQSSNSMSVVWIFVCLAVYNRLQKLKFNLREIRIIVLFIVFSFVFQNSLPSRALTPRFEGLRNAQLGNIGPVLADRVEEMEQLKRHLTQITKKNELRILDFTNAPIELNYLNDSRFVPDLSFTSFYVSHIQQLNAVDNITKFPPDAVIWEGPIGYSKHVFPGEIYLRNYLIAKKILSEYRNITSFGRYTILLPGSNVVENDASNLLQTGTCDWGLALEKFTKYSDLAGSRKSYVTKGAEGGYALSESTFIDEIFGFYVKVRMPGKYSIRDAKTNVSVDFEFSKNVKYSEGAVEIFVPVSSCPSWRLSHKEVSNFSSDDQSLEILAVSK